MFQAGIIYPNVPAFVPLAAKARHDRWHVKLEIGMLTPTRAPLRNARWLIPRVNVEIPHDTALDRQKNSTNDTYTMNKRAYDTSVYGSIKSRGGRMVHVSKRSFLKALPLCPSPCSIAKDRPRLVCRISVDQNPRVDVACDWSAAGPSIGTVDCYISPQYFSFLQRPTPPPPPPLRSTSGSKAPLLLQGRLI